VLDIIKVAFFQRSTDAGFPNMHVKRHSGEGCKKVKELVGPTPFITMIL